MLGAQWVLWFLIILSVISVALILERWSYFRTAAGKLEAGIEDALKALAPADRVSRGEYVTESLVASARLGAENRLSWLATIGSNAPFVGLFGTVLGIIRAFHDLSQSGTQGSAIVSAGISEALVATAVGLFVAIPAVVGYNYFQRRVREMLLSAERTKNGILGGRA
jgi:biopolymer transport protein ExbB